MAVKKTIAIVEATDLLHAAVENKLEMSDYRLLLVSEDETQFDRLLKNAGRNVPDADIETLNCIKDGCWEADIIVLGINGKFPEEKIKKIKEVATQKIVVCLTSQEGRPTYQPDAARNLQYLLPYSKAVYVFRTSASGDLKVAGNDEEAVETVTDLADKGGLSLQHAGRLSALN